MSLMLIMQLLTELKPMQACLTPGVGLTEDATGLILAVRGYAVRRFEATARQLTRDLNRVMAAR
jgi:hypothetical protein